MQFDLATEFDLAVRLLVAAVLGALVGLEREIHDHPAGMRTHLLVALGSSAFTVLSIFAFSGSGADPARVAAQVVSGIGFLGAGAILKEGATIRGLTTAASLWAVAAVGMAAGAGAWGVAVVLALIAVLSLWPLRVITDRLVGRRYHRVRAELTAVDPHRLGAIVDLIAGQDGTIAHLSSAHAPGGGLTATVEVRVTDVAAGAALMAALADLEGVELTEARTVID